jgi:PAS domain S-box-containing protein
MRSIDPEILDVIRACSRDDAAYERLLDAVARLRGEFDPDRAYLQALYQQSAQACFWLDTDYHILGFNDEARHQIQMLRRRELCVDDSMLDYIDLAQQASFQGHYQACLEGRKIISEGELTNLYGISTWHELLFIPVYGAGDGVIGICLTVRDITVQRLAEDALRESEARNSALLSAIPDMMFVYNRDGIILDYNAPDPALLFVPPEKFLGRRVQEVLPGYVGALISEAIERTLEIREIQVIEYSLYMEAEQTHRYFEGRCVSAGDDRVLLIVRDITESRRVMLQLLESEGRFRAIFEGASIGIAVTDHDGKVVSANQTYQDMLGYSEAELQQISFETYTHPDDLKADLKYFEELMAGAINDYRMEKRYIRKDGSLLWVQISISLFPMIHDGRELVIAMAEDISDRKQAQAALHASEQRLELALRGADLGLWDLDMRTNALVVNQRWAEMIGYALDELPQNDTFWLSLIHPDDRANVQHMSDEHLQGRQPLYEVEYRLRAKGGGWRWILSRGRVVERAEDGTPLRMTGTHLDITERKMSQQQAMEVELERERMQVLLGFVRDTSHEFRTPLSIINTKLYLLERVTDPTQRSAYIRGIQAQVENIVTLLESLVLMSRLDQADIATQFSLIRLDAVLQALRSRIADSIQQRKLSLDFEIAADLPLIYGDYDMLARALLNILDNAIRYTPANGRVSVRAFAKEEQVWVEVQDTGIGIALEAVPHIFDSFYRVDKAHTTPGFGLGLSISQRIIARHGGTIEVESEPGAGTTLRVLLPIPAVNQAL